MANTQTINLTVDGQVYNSTLGDAYDYASGWGDVSLTRRLLGLASAPAVAGDVTVRVSGAKLSSTLSDAYDYAADAGDADLCERIDWLAGAGRLVQRI